MATVEVLFNFVFCRLFDSPSLLSAPEICELKGLCVDFPMAPLPPPTSTSGGLPVSSTQGAPPAIVGATGGRPAGLARAKKRPQRSFRWGWKRTVIYRAPTRAITIPAAAAPVTQPSTQAAPSTNLPTSLAPPAAPGGANSAPANISEDASASKIDDDSEDDWGPEIVLWGDTDSDEQEDPLPA